jgi:hypothetical protein
MNASVRHDLTLKALYILAIVSAVAQKIKFEMQLTPNVDAHV